MKFEALPGGNKNSKDVEHEEDENKETYQNIVEVKIENVFADNTHNVESNKNIKNDEDHEDEDNDEILNKILQNNLKLKDGSIADKSKEDNFMHSKEVDIKATISVENLFMSNDKNIARQLFEKDIEEEKSESEESENKEEDIFKDDKNLNKLNNNMSNNNIFNAINSNNKPTKSRFITNLNTDPISLEKESLFREDFTSMFLNDNIIYNFNNSNLVNTNNLNSGNNSNNKNNFDDIQNQFTDDYKSEKVIDEDLFRSNLFINTNIITSKNSGNYNKYSNLNLEKEIQLNLNGDNEAIPKVNNSSNLNNLGNSFKNPNMMSQNIQQQGPFSPFNMSPFLIPNSNNFPRGFGNENMMNDFNHFNNLNNNQYNSPQNEQDEMSNLLENPASIVQKNITKRGWFLMTDNNKILGNFNSIDLLKYLEDKIREGSKFENIFLTDYDTDIYFTPNNLYEILKENLPKILDQIKRKKNLVGMTGVKMNAGMKIPIQNLQNIPNFQNMHKIQNLSGLGQNMGPNMIQNQIPMGNFNKMNSNMPNNIPFIDPHLIHMNQFQSFVPLSNPRVGVNMSNLGKMGNMGNVSNVSNVSNVGPVGNVGNMNKTPKNTTNTPMNYNINLQVVKNNINLNNFMVSQPHMTSADPDNNFNFNNHPNSTKNINSSNRMPQGQLFNNMFNSIDSNNYNTSSANSMANNKGNQLQQQKKKR